MIGFQLLGSVQMDLSELTLSIHSDDSIKG
jgi:hypothetical protein